MNAKGICAPSVPSTVYGSTPSICAPPTPSAVYICAPSTGILLGSVNGCIIQQSAKMAEMQLDTCEKFLGIELKPRWKPKLIMSCFLPVLIVEEQQQQAYVPASAMLEVAPSKSLTSADGPSMPLLTDLRLHLNKKRSLRQIISHCACEELIMTVLSECKCNAPPKRVLVFKWLSEAPIKTSK